MKVALLVDDKPELRHVFRLIITRYSDDFKIIEASTGKEAVALYRKYKPDIVFMDMVMPVMEGDEATHIIKKLDPSAHIVVVSAFAENGFATIVLTKPPDLGDLIKELDSIKINTLREEDTGIFYIQELDKEAEEVYESLNITDEDIKNCEDETKHISPYD
jgi:YesN/AraC family two-component response regulator